MTKLKLLAADTSDLEVIASAVQDSIFQIGQTRFDSKGRSFTLRLSICSDFRVRFYLR